MVQLKGIARKLEASYKVMHQVQTQSKKTTPQEPILVLRSKQPPGKELKKSSNTKGIPNLIQRVAAFEENLCLPEHI